MELDIGSTAQILRLFDHLRRKIHPNNIRIRKLVANHIRGEAVPATSVKDGLMGHQANDPKNRFYFKLAVVLIWVGGLIGVTVFLSHFIPEPEDIILGLAVLFDLI